MNSSRFSYHPAHCLSAIDSSYEPLPYKTSLDLTLALLQRDIGWIMRDGALWRVKRFDIQPWGITVTEVEGANGGAIIVHICLKPDGSYSGLHHEGVYLLSPTQCKALPYSRDILFTSVVICANQETFKQYWEKSIYAAKARLFSDKSYEDWEKDFLEFVTTKEEPVSQSELPPPVPKLTVESPTSTKKDSIASRMYKCIGSLSENLKELMEILQERGLPHSSLVAADRLAQQADELAKVARELANSGK